MALSVDNSAKSFVNSGTAPTLTMTIAASANLLVVEWDSADGSGGQNLTAVTAGGVSMSLVPSGAVINGLFSSQLWFLKNPPTGSVTITGTLATPISFQMLYATSFIGADSTTPLGTAVTAGGASGANSAVTATGGVSGDIYLGTTSIFATTITSGGSQTVLQSQPNAGGTVSSSIDTLPGSGSGAFSWTGGGSTSNGWTAAAVVVKQAASAAALLGSIPLPGPGISPNKQTQFYPRRLSNVTNANVTVALSGQSATFAAGNLTPSSSVPVTGSSAAFSAGTMQAFVATQGKSYIPGPGISPDYRQLFNSRNLSSFIPVAGNITVALSGQPASFSAGSLSPSSSVAVIGQSSTFATGNLGDTESGALLGQAATFSSGTLTPNITVALSGQASTFAAGTLIPTPLLSVTGSSATFAAGSLVPSINVGMTGVAGAFSAGNVIAPGDVTVALTGQSATFSAGTISASLADADIGGDPPRRRKTRNVIKNGKFVQEKIPNWPFEQTPESRQLPLDKTPKMAVQNAEDAAIVRAVVKLMFDLM